MGMTYSLPLNPHDRALQEAGLHTSTESPLTITSLGYTDEYPEENAGLPEWADWLISLGALSVVLITSATGVVYMR